MKKIKNLFKKQGFTLVELIIVIAIIAVLAVAAFMMLTKWLASSRDSRRLGDVSTIKKALNISFIEKPFYPEPDNKNAILDDDEITMWYQGVFGSGVIENMDNLQKAPVDPSDGSYFRYAVTTDQKEYQIGATLEKRESSFLNSTLAATLVASVEGDYDGYATYSSGMTYIVRTPSLLLYSGTSLKRSGDNPNLMINEEELGTVYVMKSVSFTGNPTDLAETVRDTFGLTGDGADSLALTIVKNNSTVTPSAITYAECPFEGGSLSHGASVTRYENETVAYNETCVSETRTCTNGSMKDGIGYTNATCSTEGALNCGVETKDGYELEITNHEATYNATKEDTTFTNGTKILAQSYECTNGSFATTGGETTDSIDCDTTPVEYVEDGGACVLNQCGGAAVPDTGESNATSQTYGTDWNYNEIAGVCTYVCNIGYETSACTAKTKSITTADYDGTTYDFTEFTLTYGSPVTKTSLTETVTGGTATLEVLFTLGSDGTTVTLSSQDETITCTLPYTLTAGGVCEIVTQTVTCEGTLDSTTERNTSNDYVQTWDGSSWTSTKTANYNIITSTDDCRYKCKDHYNRSGGLCVADTQVVACGGEIVANATASMPTTYTQTWNGTIWFPEISWGEDHGVCDFNCDANFVWDGSACVSAEAPPTILSLEHQSGSKTFTFSWTAGTGNGGSCKLQYLKDGITWTNIDANTYNCDGDILIASPTSVTLPTVDYNGTWSSISVRTIRTSDSAVLGTFSSPLTCSVVDGSASKTPTIDEDCNGEWDNPPLEARVIVDDISTHYYNDNNLSKFNFAITKEGCELLAVGYSNYSRGYYNDFSRFCYANNTGIFNSAGTFNNVKNYEKAAPYN